MAELHFHKGYHERVVIDDSLSIDLRPIAAHDKDNLRAGLARMSPESRYLRFFTDKGELSDKELEYLTEVDGWDHFALVASVGATPDAAPQGVGVARFIRLSHEPSVAEPAIVVLDEYGGRGIGRLMMSRLVAAARERGVQSFRSEFLASNDAVRELLKSVSDDICFKRDGSVVVADFELGPQGPPRAWEAMRHFLRLQKQETLELRRRIFGPH